MGRRGRPKKGTITYDSKETKFIIGLISLAIAIFGILSYFIDDSSSVFGFIHSLFGEATIVFALFLLNFSLSLFGANFFSTTKRSLIAQLFITVFISIILSANADPLLQKEKSYLGEYGGIIGFEIADISQNSVFLNYTSIVCAVIILILLPFVFNQNIAEFFESLKRIVMKVFTKIQKLKNKLSKSKEVQESEDENVLKEMNSPSMFSHFRHNNNNNKSKKMKSKQNQVNNSKDQKQNEPSLPDFVGIEKKQDNENETDQDISDVNVKTKSDKSTLNSKLNFEDWEFPHTDLLEPIPDLNIEKEDVENNSMIIEQTLASFGIESKVMDVMTGPSVTQYALDIALGIKVSKISNLKNDLALALATSANAVRIEVPIPGTSYVGIEVPNKQRRPVFFRELIEDKAMDDTGYDLPVAVGKDIAGRSVVADIQSMPHQLIAGATGSGKSVLTNSFIMSLLMRRTPDEVKFILVDPKQVELSDYNGIPHLLTPVIVDMDKVVNALKWAVEEMESRYTLFRENKVKNLQSYNKKMGFSALPYIVIVIDEMADMMLTSGKAEIENNIVKLAQKARATGIHLILATQRPSVNVITGIIKANIPGRIGMSVATRVDSGVILDQIGAESLLGKGDMLFKEPDKNKPYRVQGVFVSQKEVQRVVKFIKHQAEDVEYIENVTVDKEAQEAAQGAIGSPSGDELFVDAMQVVISAQKGSSSLLQRKLSIGYNRAAKLIDEMEQHGIVGPANGPKAREVLISDADSFLASVKKS